jgi:pimeloyl-ACP methyl ester carboxylesterase
MTGVRRRRRIWLLVYLVLLLTSTIVRHSIPPATLPDGMRTLSLRTVDNHLAASGQINLAFVDTAPDSMSMPVVLVHGSPGSSHIFQAVTAGLSGHARVIVPDLPGFGASTHTLPDYSFRAHAKYLLELFDALQIRKVQLVGFSMGGGVILSLADLAPDRVASM